MAVVVLRSESSVVGLLTAVSKVNCGSKKVRVLKYQLKPGLNVLQSPGTSKLRYLNQQDNKLYGWVEEYEGPHQDEYEIYLAITGEEVPLDYNYVTSYQLERSGGYFVVHAYD